VTNPDRHIFFLGDTNSIPLAGANAECHELEKYSAGAARFIESYVHLSRNPIKFTRQSIVRWFILRDFCRSHGIKSAFHTDSDVLLFASVTSIGARLVRAFGQFDVALHMPTGPFSTCGHSSLWLNLDRLDEFCAMVQGIYSSADAATFLKLVAFHQLRASSGVPDAGLVSDMTLLDVFCRRSTARIVNSGAILEAATLDHGMHLAVQDGHHFLMADGMKRLVWRSGVPHGVLEEGGALVRFDALHCQGLAKWHIPAFTAALCDEGIASAIERTPDPKDLVYAAYRVLLEREPDADGLRHWTSKLATGLTPLQLLLAIVDSREFRGRLIYDRDSEQPKRDLVVVLDALLKGSGRPQSPG